MILSQLIFTSSIMLLGVLGIALNRKNFIVLLVSIELIFLGSTLNFLMFSVMLDDHFGQVFALVILTLLAAETTIALTIIILFFREFGATQYNQTMDEMAEGSQAAIENDFATFSRNAKRDVRLLHS